MGSDDWISVEERLPEPSEDPFLTFDIDTEDMDILWFDGYVMGWTDKRYLPANCTHWQTLPDPPKSVKKEKK